MSDAATLVCSDKYHDAEPIGNAVMKSNSSAGLGVMPSTVWYNVPCGVEMASSDSKGSHERSMGVGARGNG